MAANVVTIQLQAQNGASSTISGLANQIENRLGGAFQKAAISSQLMVKGLEAGLTAVTSLVGKLSEGLSQAVDIQSDNITVAGNLMKLTGQNFQQATEFVDEFSVRMSKVAASLPGATSDYVEFGKAIADDVIPAIREANGAIDPKKLQAELEAVSTYGTLLAQQAKVSSSNAAMALSKFLGGTASKGELIQNDFFQKNTTFRNALFAEVEKLGKDVKDLTVQQRLEIFKKAANIPQEVLKAQSKSIAGITAGFTSSLFDPQTGLFGFMRDLDDKVKGNQSALTEINEGLDALIGEQGLLNTVGAVLKQLGFEPIDPMRSLAAGVKSFTSRVIALRDALDNFLETGGDASEVVDTLREFFSLDNIGKRLAELVNAGVGQVGSLDWVQIFSTIGVFLAQVVNQIAQFILSIDYGAILKTALSIGVGLFIGLGKFLSNLNWGDVLKAIGILIGTALLGVAATAIAGLVTPVIAGFGLLGTLVTAAVIGLSAVVAANWEKITTLISKGWTGLITLITSAWDGLSSNVQQVWNTVVSSVMGFFQGIKQKFDELISKIPGIGGEKPIQAQTGVVPTFANGNTGLLGAYLRESRMAPSGAVPVIANSSEAILTQAQQKALMAARGGVSIGQIVIQTAATKAEEIADEIVAVLETKLSQYAQSHIVTVEA